MALFVTITDSDKESMMKTRNLVVACCLVGGLTGCANMSSGEQRTLSGAGIGAAAGALVGELAVGRPMAGAAVGAAVGGASGYLYDRHEKSEGR
jgi:uncharacterized membrane protein